LERPWLILSEGWGIDARAWRIVAHEALDWAKARKTAGNNSTASRCKLTISWADEVFATHNTKIQKPEQPGNGVSKVADLAPEAEVTVLTSDRPTDNNSLENPKKIVPVTMRMRVDGPKFTREFPPYSFTLLTLKTE
jgi:alpha-L-arabinofuranosidase